MNNEEKFKHKLKDLLDEQDFPYSPANWDKASAVLDKEDKRKRRFLFWLFTGLGVGLSLLGILFYMNKSKAAATLVKKNTDSTLAMADKRPNTVLQTQNALNDEPEKTNVTPQTPPSKTSVKNTNAETVQHPLLNATSQPITDKTEATRVTTQKSGLATAPTNMQTKIQPVNAKKIKSTPATISNENIAAISAQKTNTATTKPSLKTDTLSQAKVSSPATTLAPMATELPGSTPLVSTNNQPTLVVSETENTSQQKPAEEKEAAPSASPYDSTSLISILPKLRTIPGNHFFYVEAGAYYNAGWTINGNKEAAAINPMAGLSYFSGVARRVGLSLGAYYTSLGQLKFSNKKAEIAKNGYGIQTAEGAVTPAYPGQGLTLVYGQEKEVTSITPASLHYVVVPAKLQFFITHNQAITFGYSFAYLLDVRSKVETYTENYSTRVYKGSYTTGGYVEGFKTYCSQITVAYRRRLYKNIWANAELLYGLSDLRDDTFFGIKKYERATGINLSLTYNLLKK